MLIKAIDLSRNCFRFGVGKKGLEEICLEELFYLNKEIQSQNENPFNISVKFKQYLKPQKYVFYCLKPWPT